MIHICVWDEAKESEKEMKANKKSHQHRLFITPIYFEASSHHPLHATTESCLED
jgi:hypothetical protein